MKRIVAAVAAVAAVILAAGPAWAHVEVSLDGLGSDRVATASFEVPNERPDSGTVGLEVDFPDSPVIPTVTTAPLAGWTASVEMRSLAAPVTVNGKQYTQVAAKVVWTGGPLTGTDKIKFSLTLGPIPAGADTVELKALQTYQSGEVVRWIEPTPKGGDEPEHPTPVLELGKKGGEGGTAAKPAKKMSDDGGMGAPVVVAIVAGAVAVIGAVVIIVRRRARPWSQSS